MRNQTWAVALWGLWVAGCAGLSPAKQGDEYLAAGRYDDAIRAYQDALAEHPTRRIQDKLSEARRLEADRLRDEAALALAEGQAAIAFDTFVAALAQDPEDLAALDGLARSRDLLLEQARHEERQGHLDVALPYYERILSQFKRHPEAQAGRERILRAQADALATRAATLADTRPATALSLWLQVADAIPDHPTAAAEALRLRDRLLSTAQSHLHLDLKAGPGVRADLRPWPPAVDATFAQQRGTLRLAPRGAKRQAGDLTATLVLDRLETRRETANQTVNAYTTPADAPKPNPAWEALTEDLQRAESMLSANLADLRAAETAWQDARAALADAPGSDRALARESEARLRFERARSDVAQWTAKRDDLAAQRAVLPPTLGGTPAAAVSYVVQEVAVMSTLHLTGRCDAVGDDAYRHTIDITLTREARDQAHVAVPALGLAADPLVNPDARALESQLLAEAQARLTTDLLDCRAGQIDALWEVAHRLVAQGWREPAADALMRAWLAAPERGREEALAYLAGELGAPRARLDALFPEG